MIQIKPILDAYIDANIVIGFAFLLWVLARFILNRTEIYRAYTVRLNIVQGVILAVCLSPLCALGFGVLNTWLFPETSLNLADLAVAQYLNGNLQINAVDFEVLLGLRQQFTDNLIHLKTPLAVVVVTAIVTGFLFNVVQVGSSVFRLHQIISDSHLWHRFGRLELRLSDAVQIPFSTRGLTRRYIIIPSAMLGQADNLRIALAHEFQHLRRRDVEWELALQLIKPFFFWNPAFLLWQREVENLRELSCDQNLLLRRRVSPRDYANCLLELCEASVMHNARHKAITPNVPFLVQERSLFGNRAANTLRQRVSAIFETPPRLRMHNAYLPVLCMLAVLIFVAAFSLKKPDDWSHDRLMLSTIVNLERLQALNTGGQAGF